MYKLYKYICIFILCFSVIQLIGNGATLGELSFKDSIISRKNKILKIKGEKCRDHSHTLFTQVGQRLYAPVFFFGGGEDNFVMEFKNILNHSCRYPAEIKGSSVVFLLFFKRRSAGFTIFGPSFQKKVQLISLKRDQRKIQTNTANFWRLLFYMNVLYVYLYRMYIYKYNFISRYLLIFA